MVRGAPAASSAAAHLIAARSCLRTGDLEGAATEARRAARIDPNNAEAHGLWGVASAERGAFAEAVEPLATAARLAHAGTPRWVLLQSQLARSLCNAGRWAEGLSRLEPLESAPPADPAARRRMGVSLVSLGLSERGLAHLEWAASAGPMSPSDLCDLAWALTAAGRLEQAEETFTKALRVQPDMPRALIGLADLRRATSDWDPVDELTRARSALAADDPDRASLGFALFKVLDGLDRCSEAWDALVEANEAAARATRPWSAATGAALVDGLIRAFPAPRFSRRQDASGDGPTPIFVVGLPRSGTTLVERILAAHSQTRSLGEAPFFPRLFAASCGAPGRIVDATVVAGAKRADWRAVGAAYRAEAAALSRGARFTIDKLPFNNMLAGAIRLALPEARIVNLNRDPMDALFGAYKMRFSDDTWYGWSASQSDLASHFAAYRRLMDHWRAVLGETFIDISYERLVAASDTAIRDLLTAVGQPFEAACLRPEQAEGAVLTASMSQVRRPISGRYLGAWRRYEAQLEPLRVRLAEEGLLANANV